MDVFKINGSDDDDDLSWMDGYIIRNLSVYVFCTE